MVTLPLRFVHESLRSSKHGGGFAPAADDDGAANDDDDAEPRLPPPPSALELIRAVEVGHAEAARRAAGGAAARGLTRFAAKIVLHAVAIVPSDEFWPGREAPSDVASLREEDGALLDRLAAEGPAACFTPIKISNEPRWTTDLVD